MELVKYDAMRTAIVEAHSVDEVKDIRDKAEALRAYAKQSKRGIDDINMVTEIKLRAERRAGEILRELPTNQGDRTDVTSSQRGKKLETKSEVIRDSGISNATAGRWQQIADLPEEIFEQHIDETKASDKELTTASVLNVVKEKKKKERRKERVNSIIEISKNNEEIDIGIKYPIIYADPPWKYEHTKTENRRVENHYPTMTLQEICDLPITELASPDAVLFLWTTSPKLAESMEVIDSWGFVYRTCIVWDKERIGILRTAVSTASIIDVSSELKGIDF